MARDSEDDRVPGLAAEVAFFALLSVFPGLLGVAAGLGALDKVFGSELAGQAQRDVVTVLETSLALLTIMWITLRPSWPSVRGAA
jgi:membrane protein